MRNRVSIAATLALLVFASAARAEGQDWGIKGGVNLGDVKWGEETVTDTKSALGAIGGVFVRFRPFKALPLQVEGLVTQVVIDFSAEGVDLTHTLTDLQVPVLVRYTVVSGSSVRVSAAGGAAADVVLVAKDSVNSPQFRDGVAPWSASLLAAAEVEWRRWVFDVRYVFGVTDLYRDKVAEDFPAKQRAIQITAGWRF